MQRKITEDTELAGRKMRASKDDPQHSVRSDKSGARQCTNRRRWRKKGDGDGHRAEEAVDETWGRLAGRR